jgi:signal peptidase II
MSVIVTSRRAWVDTAVLLLTAGLVYGLDRLTKAWIDATLAIGEQVHLVGDLVQIWHVENAGAAFSLFQGGRWILLGVSVGAVILVAWFHWRLRGNDQGRLVHVVLGLILGGALGNFADRVVGGTVTDWISVGIGNLRFPTFNVADAALTMGVVGILLLSFVWERQRGRSS